MSSARERKADDPAEMDVNLRAFVLDAMRLDGVSVGVEDDGGRVIVTVGEHDTIRSIDAEAVHELVREHGATVVNSRSDFERREHVVEVVR